ncbi:MAG: class I SAM-dependent methyltransferase [Tepidisphaeraceae bacterium]|jgi:cyclopropane-fatty-acyl-phospholipid synthase
MNTNRRPAGVDFKRVQAHYDLGDDFFALFLDPSMTYSCAKFDTPQTTLAQAQSAKIDLSLGKCELRPGHRLLDIGCGWGATAMRAHEHYGASVIGLTISQNQLDHDQKLAAGRPGLEFRLQGWETFEEKVDRIVSIGAFEHFGRNRYPAFFARCRSILPPDGVLLLHTITIGKPNEDWDFLRFVHFIATEIFPGGDVPPPELLIAAARAASMELVHVESLRPHYALTLDHWAANLEARRDDAITIAGVDTYLSYMKYLTGCAALFRSGECNVHQFKFRVA